MPAISFPTTASALQHVLPARFISILASRRSFVCVWGKAPNSQLPVTHETGYRVKLAALAKQLRDMQDLPEPCKRFLRAWSKKVFASKAEVVIPESEVQEDPGFGALVRGGIL